MRGHPGFWAFRPPPVISQCFSGSLVARHVLTNSSAANQQHEPILLADLCARKAILKRARDISRVEYGVTQVFKYLSSRRGRAAREKMPSHEAVIAMPAIKVKPFSSLPRLKIYCVDNSPHDCLVSVLKAFSRRNRAAIVAN